MKSEAAGSNLFLCLILVLVSLAALDGLISQFLISNGLGTEGNPFMETWVTRDVFPAVKVAGASLCAILLRDINRRRPRFGLISTWCVVGVYGLIVLWNLSIVFIS